MSTALLEGKVALITGAGRGLGWGIARALGRAGAKVCATDINAEELAQTVDDLASDDSTAMAIELDVSDRAAFAEAVRQVVERWGRLDVLVHNAIYMPLVRFDALTDASWQRQLDVGLGGLYNGTRAVWDVMKRQGGGH